MPPIQHPQTGVGVWLRRYRRYLPLPLILVCLIWLRPMIPGGSSFLDTVTDLIGVGVCALGQWFRLWAWGSNATVGKWGVRGRGPYTLMRHPLYTGNFLIAAGLVVIFNNPWAYLLFLVPLAYLYHVITNMEEKRMHRRFGEDWASLLYKPTKGFSGAAGNETGRIPCVGALRSDSSGSFLSFWEFAKMRVVVQHGRKGSLFSPHNEYGGLGP
jgi:hypothetical protein